VWTICPYVMWCPLVQYHNSYTTSHNHTWDCCYLNI